MVDKNNTQMGPGGDTASALKAMDYEPIPANKRARDNNAPSGLKNVGNSKNTQMASIVNFFVLCSLLFQFTVAGPLLPAKHPREDTQSQSQREVPRRTQSD